MKKIYLMFLSLIIIFSACKKSDKSTSTTTPTYEKINKPILIVFTEPYCCSCGSYADPTFDTIIHLEPATISGMEVSEIISNYTPQAEGMYSDFGIEGIPQVFIDTTLDRDLNVSLVMNYNWAVGITNSFVALPVTAAIMLSKSISGSTMNVSCKVKFYTAQDAGKVFCLAIYIVEDNYKCSQVTENGTIPNFNHRNVLRTGNTTSYKGDTLNNSNAITVNQEFSKSYNISLNTAWVVQNLKVIAVIWNVPGSGLPSVVNTNTLL